MRTTYWQASRWNVRSMGLLHVVDVVMQMPLVCSSLDLMLALIPRVMVGVVLCLLFTGCGCPWDCVIIGGWTMHNCLISLGTIWSNCRVHSQPAGPNWGNSRDPQRKICCRDGWCWFGSRWRGQHTKFRTLESCQASKTYYSATTR